MSILNPLISAWSWFKKVFVSHTSSAASIAVTITETVKALLSNPITKLFENVADAITHTQLPTEIANTINSVIPKILAVELGIQGLPDNPTEADILAFEQAVLNAFSISSDNSKLYTTLGAQIYGIIKSKLEDGKFTFAEAVDAVEQAWAAYQSDLAANPGIIDAPVGTKLANGNIIVQSAADALQEASSPNSGSAS